MSLDVTKMCPMIQKYFYKAVAKMLSSELEEDEDKIQLLDALLGRTDNEDQCLELSHETDLINTLIKLALKENSLSSKCFNILINMLSYENVAEKIICLNFSNSSDKPHIFWIFWQHIFLLKENYLECIHLLCNLTRLPSLYILFTEDMIKKHSETVNRLLEIAFSVEENTLCVQRDEAASLVLNLSQSSIFIRYFLHNLMFQKNVFKVLEQKPSEKWKFFIFGLLKNICKTPDFHTEIVSDEYEILSTILFPLVGDEKLDEEIMINIPLKLRPEEGKLREADASLRITLLEALYLLSGTSVGRTTLRNYNVYNILKAYSEWLDVTDKEGDLCLDIIGLLIRTEEEISCDNLLTLKIPEHLEEKLANMT